jgi:hypothetical protein
MSGRFPAVNSVISVHRQITAIERSDSSLINVEIARAIILSPPQGRLREEL